MSNTTTRKDPISTPLLQSNDNKRHSQPRGLMRQSHILQSRRASSTGTSTGTPTQHYCYACDQPCTHSDRKHINALGRLYHYQCFVCEDCHTSVTSRYYAIERGNQPSIVCEKHYYIHTQCAHCNERFQADTLVEWINGLKYHQQCIQCPGCLLAKRASSSSSSQSSFTSNGNWKMINRGQRQQSHEQFEEKSNSFTYDGKSYCRYHYSLLRGTACIGCGQAVLDKPVEDDTERGRWWHYECFKIYKYWQVKLVDPRYDRHDEFSTMSPNELIAIQTTMETTRKQVWTELHAFEDSLATYIYDLGLHITAGSFHESVSMARQLAWHLRALFTAHQSIHTLYTQHDLSNQKVPECNKWTRLIGSQIIQLFQLFDTQKEDEERHVFGKKVFDFVGSLANSLKVLLHDGLVEALQLEHNSDVKNVLSVFLQPFGDLKRHSAWIPGRYLFKESPFPETATAEQEDKCRHCQKVILDPCLRHGVGSWHLGCLICGACKKQIQHPRQARVGYHTEKSGHVDMLLLCDQCTVDPRNRPKHVMQQTQLIPVSQLEQCMHLLRVALARVEQQTTTTLATGKNGLKKMQHAVDDKTKHSQNRQQPLSSSPASFRQLTVDTGTAAAAAADTTTTMQQNAQPQQQQQPTGTIYWSNVKRMKSSQADSTTTTTPHTIGNTPTPRRALTIHQPSSEVISPTSPSSSPTSKFVGYSTLRRALSTGRGTRNHTSSTLPAQQQRLHEKPTVATLQRHHCLNNSCKNEDAMHWLVDVSDLQDFLLRNLAALYVERYVGGYFEIEELLALVEPRKESLWGKVKLHFRSARQYSPADWMLTTPSTSSSPTQHTNGNNNNINNSTRVFGVSLSSLATKQRHHPKDQPARANALQYVTTHHPTIAAYISENVMAPIIVQDCILALLQQDLAVEGIFRKNGNIRELREMSQSVDRGEPYFEQLMQISSSIQLAALLKRFIRDMPEPLLTFRLYNLFLSSLQMETEQETKAVLHLACCMLPKPNRDFMQLLFLFLNHVASFHAKNLMDIHNLAVVLTPGVFYAPPTMAERYRMPRDEIRVVHLLIKYQAEFITVPKEFNLVMQDSGMIKSLYHADLTSSKDFVRTYANMMKMKKQGGNAVGVSPLASRSAIALTSAPPQARMK